MRVRALLIAGLASLAAAAPAQADVFTVTNGSSDSTAACSGTTCPSLRAAIAAAEITRPADTINVPAGTININNDLVVGSEITIVGTSARSNIIDGGAKYRGLRVAGTGVAVLSHFTIRNGAAGQASSNDGGAILVQQGGSLALDYVRITASRATRGGGIANLRGSLGIQHSLIDKNIATGDGGGIFNLGGVESPELAVLQMADSTVFDNTAGDSSAGGIASRQLGSLVAIGRSTIADNTGGKAGVGGLAVAVTARVQVTGSILARNIGDSVVSNCSATKPTDGGFNVENSTQCAFGGGGNNVNPLLDGDVTNAGGEVDVLAMPGSSPAVNRLPVSTTNCPAGTFDQRSMYRPQGAACDSGAFEVDQPGTMTINSGPSGTVTSGDVEFTFSSSEPGVSPVCQLTGPGQSAGYVDCYKSNAQPYSGLGNGSYTFSVRDGAFASATPDTQTFTVAALDTAITGGPTGATNDSTPTFTFTGTSASSFQCRFDLGLYNACTSPFTPATALSEGAHVFEVRALSAAGGPDPTPASRSFTVDTAVPDTTITSGPSGTISSTSATFVYTSTESPSTFQCSFDGAAFSACPAGYTGLAQGSHTFQVRATDAAGNVDATPATRTWIVDTVAPDTTITGGPSGSVNSTSATFTYTSTESPGIFQCALDGAAFAACPASYTGLAQGSHTFQVRANDIASNTDATPASRTWIVDTVAPDTTITAGPSGSVSSTSATFTYSSTETPQTFQCALDGAAFAACPASYTGLSQGSHTFQVRASDAAGNVDGTPASRTWTVDTVAPDTTITAGPSGSVASTSATFTYTSTETPQTFQCSFDGAAFSACPASYTGLSQGSHTFAVRATDAAGNVDATPASRTWTVDTVAPDTTITAGPSGNVASTSATFTYTSTETPQTFQCALDGAAFAACPASYTGLSQGSHTFQVRATDAAGNLDATPASRTWTVDTVAPDTTITAFTPSPSNDTTPTWSFTSEPGTTFECRVDTAAFVSCGSPFTSAALPGGAHTFEVRAVDAAGNTDASPASQAFVIDVTAPDTTLTPVPSPSNDTTPTFNFSSEGGATFQCRIDGAAFTSCSSPVTTAALGDGTHTFDVRATDSVGNVDPTPATQTFVIDTAAPNTTLTPITTPNNDPTPTFTFSSEAGATFQCRVDTAAFASCSSPFTTAALTDGSHTFEVRATDTAGNTDATPASQTFVIDTTTPNTTITDGPGAATNDTTPTFTFTGSGGTASFQCRVDGAAYATCTSPFTTTALSAGSHTVDIRALTAAGTPDPSPATSTFVVDLTAPDTTLTPVTSPGNDATPTFSFSSEAGATFQCRVDGAAFASCSSPFTTTSLADGTHSFDVRATDAAGNTDATPASQTFVIDTAAPNTTLTPTATPSNDTTPTFAFSSEAGASFECRVDAAAFASCTSPMTTAALSEGTHTFDVRARDAAGNADTTPASQTFVVDITAPNTTLTPIVSPNNDATPTFTFSSEAGATFQCRVDGAAFASCSSPFTTSALTDGSHTFEVRATDTAGNTDATPASQTFVIDTTTPNTTLTDGPGARTNDTTPTFTFTGTSGTASFQCRVDGAAYATCTSPFTTAVLSAGSHTVDIRALTAAGTPDPSPATSTFIVDLTAPETTITSPAPGPGASPQFTFTSDDASAQFDCKLDAAAFAPCTSPQAYSNLSDGQHTFSVRAGDQAGNVDATPASVQFIVDTTPPPPPAVDGPSGVTTDTTPEFTFGSPQEGVTFQCSLDGEAFGPCTSPKQYSGVAPGEHTFAVRVVDASGPGPASTRPFTVAAVQQATPTPTPSPSPTATPTPVPTPVADQSVGIRPISGKALVKLPGSTKFVRLDPSVIKNGAEVDTRDGVVEITRADGGVAKFYAGIFKLSQSGGFTILTLTEKLTGCKTSKKKAAAAAKKPKTRKLWGDGKGKFRTRGQYSAATIRGTKWLVQDTCTTTVTKVVQGVVSVNDFAKKKTVLVKKGKAYTARAKKK